MYSVRSVLSALPGVVGNFHLILYDFAFEASKDGDLLRRGSQLLLSVDKLRVAQTPSWLNFSRLQPSRPDRPQLRYATHSELFRLPSGDRHGNVEDPKEHARKEQAWRSKALPTYSSKSIESRLGWLPGLADTFVAMNDDFFLLRPHAVSHAEVPH